jgi:hypothetical protein
MANWLERTDCRQQIRTRPRAVSLDCRDQGQSIVNYGGNQAPEFAEAVKDCRSDQIVIDLVRLPISGSLLTADYRGICW